MTTIYSSRAARSRLRSPKLFLLAALLVVLTVPLVIWRDAAAGLFWSALAPAMAARDALDGSEAARLRAELASTTAAVADRDALYEENLALKARLGRQAGIETVLAGVIARPPAVPYDTLIIDAGEEQGIAAGDLVAAGGTALIGEVAQVYGTNARVELFSAPGRTYEGLLRGTVPVSVSGQGGGSLAGQVPAGTEVSAGDAVVFPGIAGGLASAVSYVSAKEGESFQTVYMHLPADPLALRYVEVWTQRHAR